MFCTVLLVIVACWARFVVIDGEAGSASSAKFHKLIVKRPPKRATMDRRVAMRNMS